MRRPLLPLLLLTVVGAVAALAPSCSRPAKRPSVLLVTIDTLRADHCSPYGYGVPTTPVLAKLASAGTLFRTAYAISSTTSPSHASLMTSSPFRTIGVFKNGQPLAPDAVTLAEVMAGAGYATAGFVSSFPLRSRFGFGQGFEFFDDDFTNEEASIGRRSSEDAHDRLGEATFARVKAWLDQRRDTRPLFLWVHFVDPHFPYKAPEKFQARWPATASPEIKRYDAEVRYADKQLGRLVAEFDKEAGPDGGLVIVTSDHGEGLGDHNWMSHGINLYEEAVRVPLVVRWPGHVEAGKTVSEPVALIDIAATVLDAAKIAAPPTFEGRSLFAAADPDRAIFLQRRAYKENEVRGVHVSGEMTAVVRNGSKYIVAPDENRRELYHLPEDPREAVNLIAPEGPASAGPATPPPGEAGKEGSEAAAVAAPSGAPTEAAAPPSASAEARHQDGILAAWRDAHPEVEDTNKPMSKEDAKALRSLGYVE